MIPAPLVLLHGYTGVSADWDAVRARLGAAQVLVAPIYGHRGHREAEGADFDLEVARLAAAVEAAGFEGSHLVGYSLGGRLALGLLVRYPRLFSRATLIAAQPGLRDEAFRAERRRADELWCDLLEAQRLDVFFDRWQAQPLLASQSHFPERVAARRVWLREQHDARALAQGLRALGLGSMPDHWPLLSAVELPVRLVVGDLDPKFAALASEMLGLLPAAELRVISSCGHNPVFEQPAALAAVLELSPTERTKT